MKNPKYLLRGIQTLTIITIIAIGVMTIQLFTDNLNESGTPSSQHGSAAKIKRPKLSKNLKYQDLVNQGNEYFSLYDFDPALEAYQKASEMEPKETLPYEKIGDIYFLQKNYESARQNFELAESLTPENKLLAIKITRTMIGQRKISDAKIKIEKIEPQTQESIYYKGLIETFLNQQEEAQKSLKQVLETGVNEEIKKNAKKILDIYSNFELERNGTIEHLQVLLAQAFDQIGEYGMAIELTFDAIKTKNDYRDAWIVLGHAFLNEYKWFDAEDALKKAIDLDVFHPAAFFFRGLAKKNLNKTDEAMDDFKQAIKLGFKPQIAAKFELAEILFALKKFDEAFELYKDVVTTDPNDINRFIRPIALAINHVKKPNEALELAKKAFDSHPNTAMAHNLLGWAYISMNDFASGRRHLEEALKRDPELAAAYLNLGQLEQAQNNGPEAIKNYQKALELAEKSNDSMSTAIFNTAQEKISVLQNEPPQSDTQNEPQTEKIQPSLSLE